MQLIAQHFVSIFSRADVIFSTHSLLFLDRVMCLFHFSCHFVACWCSLWHINECASVNHRLAVSFYGIPPGCHKNKQPYRLSIILSCSAIFSLCLFPLSFILSCLTVLSLYIFLLFIPTIFSYHLPLYLFLLFVVYCIEINKNSPTIFNTFSLHSHLLR